MGKIYALHSAKAAKNDEFYTLLPDIENEVEQYKKWLLNKVIYCNCDDYRYSNFYVYFRDNFKRLRIKKLITTCYTENGKGLYSEYIGDGVIVKKELNGDGDFRSDECIEILKKSDIVITNPPFSLFRDLVSQIVEFKKDFLIIGNLTSAAYKVVYNLIKTNKVSLGYNHFKNGVIRFRIPKKIRNDKISGSLLGSESFAEGVVARWFTTLPINRKTNISAFPNRYVEGQFDSYINYNAINVDKIIDIPMDYEGEMGVPISFMDKYDPNVWEIIGIGKSGRFKPLTNRTQRRNFVRLSKGISTGKPINLDNTLFLKYRYTDKYYPMFKDVETGELFYETYVRLFIKNKHPIKDKNFKLFLGSYK